MWNYAYTDELYHYGVKGQKWGFRRFRTKSGKLTPAGKKRNASSVENPNKKKSVKKAVIIGSVAAGAAVTALVGAYAIGIGANARAIKNMSSSPRTTKSAGKALSKIGDTKMSDLLAFRREVNKPVTQNLADIIREIG